MATRSPTRSYLILLKASAGGAALLPTVSACRSAGRASAQSRQISWVVDQ